MNLLHNLLNQEVVQLRHIIRRFHMYMILAITLQALSYLSPPCASIIREDPVPYYWDFC